MRVSCRSSGLSISLTSLEFPGALSDSRAWGNARRPFFEGFGYRSPYRAVASCRDSWGPPRRSPEELPGPFLGAPFAWGNARRPFLESLGFRRPERAAGLVGGTTLVAPNGPKRSQNRRFPEGAGPAPRPESQPPCAPPNWLRRGRFRVLLGATLLPDGCPVGVRRQVWTAQGGLKPPCIVTLSMPQPRIIQMRDCTSARSRATWEGVERACGPGEFRC